jgi:hypothetical protein
MVKAKEKEQVVEISGLDLAEIRVPIVGLNSLIMNKFSDRALQKISDKQSMSANRAAGRVKRDPEQEYQDSLHVMPDGRYGIPAFSFKAAMVCSARFTGGQMKQTVLRGAFHILGDYVPIKGTPSMRRDYIRLNTIGKPADLRYRAEFKEWETELPIRFNQAVISKEQLIQLIHIAGFSNGVGDWRPEHGLFDVKQNVGSGMARSGPVGNGQNRKG